MNLADILSAEEVKKQIAWDRRELAVKMREAGLKYRDIGKHFGVNVSRARQLVEGQRWEKAHGRRSPLDKFYNAEFHQYVTNYERRRLREFFKVLDPLDRKIQSD